MVHHRVRARQRTQPQQPTPPQEKKTVDHRGSGPRRGIRGERIDTGKTIHRGGKETGHVPGATPQKP